ncbi:biotin--[acetyl-CoA-carboxylase] ligase [Sulfurimonas sp.]|uniref:biotin--[acetyl-CoA-carboxylase] ligase n=1 Tax=Sulfurimonas sp. TaxID=2022749 RepID=UPI002B497ABA|nr:biotin--[acetyl-CoA-carboxylase] ligase [Sulfurimonas sp.]
MQILYLDTVDSTQKYLKNLLKDKRVNLPYAVVSNIQTKGVGSRDNFWHSLEGNLFLSFAIELKNLPKDLKIESSSIYFAYILKNTLNELGSEVWLKWPNDFYLDDKKIGGMITNMIDNVLICGVGLNILTSPKGFSKLDINISRELLLNNYFSNIAKNFSWKEVFSKYELEFENNKNFFTHSKSLRISLENAKLLSDGSVISNGERIYSTR